MIEILGSGSAGRKRYIVTRQCARVSSTVAHSKRFLKKPARSKRKCFSAKSSYISFPLHRVALAGCRAESHGGAGGDCART